MTSNLIENVGLQGVSPRILFYIPCVVASH
jgi:hypothetical protein